MQSTRATPTPKKRHCRSCGSPMEGHKRNECPGTLGTFLKTPTPSPASDPNIIQTRSRVVSPFRDPLEEQEDRKPPINAILLGGELDSPIPMASIYASSDVSLSEIQQACEHQSNGKYHAGVFYTPNPTCNKELDGIKDKGENKGAQGKYNEWVIVGQDAELVRRVVRGDKPPGAFSTATAEVVEGPRMVTIPQLVFAGCVAGLAVWYMLSIM